MPSGEAVDTRTELAPVLEIALEGRSFRFDEAAYAATAPTERRALEASLDQVLAKLCLQAPIAEVLRAAASIAQGDSALRRRAALRLIWALLSGDPRVQERSRLALLILILGLLDLHHARDSVFRRFVLCLAGMAPAPAPDQGVDLFAILPRRLFRNLSLIQLLTPATLVLITVFCRMARPDIEVNARLSELRTPDRAGYRDISWAQALRLGLFLSGCYASDNVLKQDLVLAVVAGGLASGHQDPGSVPPGLVERAARCSIRMNFVSLQVTFEDDPAGFRRRHSASPYLFRQVHPPERVDAVLDSDGSEFIGYERSATTGEVVAVERDELTAPLRGSRGCRRWNNEPVRRARLADATVTPLGLVLFGEDSILDFEFANLPNRSGSPVDRHHVGNHRELILSSDRSAVLSPFPVRDIDRGALLSGLPNMANYGHFIFNGVSKFPLLRAGSGAGGSVVVPGERASFHDAIIAYCGLDPASFVFTDARLGIRAGCLDVYSEAPMGKWPYNLLAALRAELPRLPTGDGPRRIFLARPEPARRSLGNEAALIDLLAGFGFAVVRPELLPFPEQVAALEAAEVIVAPHGSALATLIFCHGAKRIVEIETKTSYRMALYNFLNHQAIRVPGHHPQVPDGTSRENVPYAVDLDIARAAVAWAVGG